jgi:hypothetical protein
VRARHLSKRDGGGGGGWGWGWSGGWASNIGRSAQRVLRTGLSLTQMPFFAETTVSTACGAAVALSPPVPPRLRFFDSPPAAAGAAALAPAALAVPAFDLSVSADLSLRSSIRKCLLLTRLSSKRTAVLVLRPTTTSDCVNGCLAPLQCECIRVGQSKPVTSSRRGEGDRAAYLLACKRPHM